ITDHCPVPSIRNLCLENNVKLIETNGRFR
ncbi:DeoR family transcriptional regulator, partial [Rhizobium ruizarguesonis]